MARQCVTERWLNAGDRGDVDAFDDLMHADVVVHAPAGLSTNSRQAEKQVWRDALAAMPDLHHAIQEVLIAGDTEMAHVTVTGTLVTNFGGVSGTGRSFQYRSSRRVPSARRQGRGSLGDRRHRIADRPSPLVPAPGSDNGPRHAAKSGAGLARGHDVAAEPRGGPQQCLLVPYPDETRGGVELRSVVVRRHLDPGHAIAGGLDNSIEHQLGGHTLAHGIGIDEQVLKL